MTGSHWRRGICTLLIAGLSAPVVPHAEARESHTADQRVIRCESRNYRYTYCRADTDNTATLVRQESPFARCDLGRTWGYDGRGVWVDRGCAGEFRVGRSGGGDAAAAVGVIAGAAILAAIVAANKDKHTDEVPSWAVGRFQGFDDRENANLEVRIDPGGAADGSADGQRFTGRWTRDRLELAKFRFRVTRAGNGFNAVDEADSGHRIYFTPAGWNR